MGNILSWRQERAGQSPFEYAFAYDAADQLVAAVQRSTDATPVTLARRAWAYDSAGNRTVEQADDAVFHSAHDALNRLLGRAPGGGVVFAGTVSEPASVTIGGQRATVDSGNAFRGVAAVSTGTSVVTVRAVDPSGNVATQDYEVDTAGETTSYTYDANGNLTGDGTRTFQWNARNELVRVEANGVEVASFVYDGLGRRVQKVAGGVTHTYVYDGDDIIEERAGTEVTRYVHGPGIDNVLARTTNGSDPRFYLADHLGSVVQETNGAGVVTLVREYDPWGIPLQAAETSGYAFTGREWDAEIGLYFYRSRYYNADRSNFISADTIGLAGGANFFAYAMNGPLRWRDPFGHDVVNNSGGTIWVKPEDNKTAVPLRPGERYSGKQDGIAVPNHRPGEVFKTTNGIDAVVGKDGNVTTSGGTLLEKFAQSILGGWKDESWNKNLNKRQDDGWNDLFSHSLPPRVPEKEGCP